MARFVYLAAIAAIASVASGAVVDLPEGEFYRPSGEEVSGFVNATTTYTRSPCPALNSMANHGYLPRDGKNLSRELIKAALMKIFNLDDTISSSMAGQSPEGIFSLADLSKHNMIEHDVSFNREDSYIGADPSFVTPKYMSEMLKLATPTLTVEKTAWLRARRNATCVSTNPKCEYGATQQATANFQSALMLTVLGGGNNESISYEFVDAFFNKETFPAGYTKPTPAVALMDIIMLSSKVASYDITGLDYDVSSPSSSSSSASGSGAGSVGNSSSPAPAPSSAPVYATTGLITATITATALSLTL